MQRDVLQHVMSSLVSVQLDWKVHPVKIQAHKLEDIMQNLIFDIQCCDNGHSSMYPVQHADNKKHWH